jgi:hypothetical protein
MCEAKCAAYQRHYSWGGEDEVQVNECSLSLLLTHCNNNVTTTEVQVSE